MIDYYVYLRQCKQRFPNYYKKHYDFHAASSSIPYRTLNAAHLVESLAAYTDKPNEGQRQALELMTDYILAEDHKRGLLLRRDADKKNDSNEEYPPLGEGAQAYMERSLYECMPLSPKEKKRLKRCEICESDFIDESWPGNARVCGPTCRQRKDNLRHRESYNLAVHDREGETRIKREWQRQDFEYPFYNPEELRHLAERSEVSYEDDDLDAIYYKDDEEFDQKRLNGKRKPTRSLDEEYDFESIPYNYFPTSRDKFRKEEDFARESGPVTVRNMKDLEPGQLESEKFVMADKRRGIFRLNAGTTRTEAVYTSEKNAV